MASPRDIRRLAFQALFFLDARGDEDEGAVRDALETQADDDPASFSPEERDRAAELALAAYRTRRFADDAMRALAPTWPAQRQPAVDRAILRLAHYEMTATPENPKVVVNDAVEIAKRFSTDRSPAFVNGLLDKILKQVLASSRAEPPASAAPGGEA